MRVGFTGTRDGLRHAQAAMLVQLLRELGPFLEFHHGDCVGADANAVLIVGRFGWADCKIHCHPPDNDSLRAFTDAHVLYTPKPYLSRNADIVAACDVMVVCPKENQKKNQGGTWHTYRTAKRAGKVVYIVWPDGSVLMERVTKETQ